MDEPTLHVEYTENPSLVDWARVKEALVSDGFDNGRTPRELEESFTAGRFAVFAWRDGEVVGTGRLLSDGVCNSYLVDVWTRSDCRRRGIGRRMVSHLLQRVPGHHVALFTDGAVAFYSGLGFRKEEVGMSCVVGDWLNRGHPNKAPG
jgi:ribosomal protein S18 acetylase RimI-like enzyme